MIERGNYVQICRNPVVDGRMRWSRPQQGDGKKRCIRELREIRRMVIRIQSEMAYGKRTLPEICLLFGQCMEEPYRTAFLSIYRKLEENDGTDLSKDMGGADRGMYEGTASLGGGKGYSAEYTGISWHSGRKTAGGRYRTISGFFCPRILRRRKVDMRIRPKSR